MIVFLAFYKSGYKKVISRCVHLETPAKILCVYMHQARETFCYRDYAIVFVTRLDKGELKQWV
jgi:hypothetical protein